MSNEPVSGTKEWAASSFNVMRGCTHGCLYCYACAMSPRQGGDVSKWANEEAVEKWARRGFGKRQGTIMFPTAHDITPDNIIHCLPVLKRALKPGNDLLIVSKPHLAVVKALCGELADYKDHILFRFTIGSLNDNVLAFWEPGAPDFSERFASLQHAFNAGFHTSISMEPLLDTVEYRIVQAVEKFKPFVTDSIWLGKANHLIRRLKVNGHMGEIVKYNIDNAVAELLASQSDEWIKALYETLKGTDKVKWKDSIKQVVGLERPTVAGLDE